MKRILLACCLTFALLAQGAFAAAYEWTVGSGGNGHFYEPVLAPGGIDWLAAKSLAEASGGYLATITSAQENTFVHSLIASSQYWINVGEGSRGPWLGGFQPDGSIEPAGGWAWVTGESFVYQNWAAGEPNNGMGFGGPSEGFMVYGGLGLNNFANTWNDLPVNGGAVAFVVEYVPEPGVGALCGVSLFALILRRRAR